MVEILLIMAVAFIFIFIFSLLEVVWLSIYEDEVIAYERRHFGGSNRVTRCITGLVRQRMVVVGFILFAIHLITYFTPLLLGRLSKNLSGGLIITTVLVIYAIVLFFFGEVVSKNIGYRFAFKSGLLSAMPLKLLLWVFSPVTWLLSVTNKLTGGKDVRLLFTEEDVVAAAQTAEEHGSLHPAETTFIQRMLTIGNKQIGELMIPLEKSVHVSLHPTREQLRQAAEKYSRIVVCSSEHDYASIMGVISVCNVVSLLCGEPLERLDLTQKLRPLFTLSTDTVVAQAYLLLYKNPIAVVTEHGRTVGIVTLRTILESIAGTEGE